MASIGKNMLPRFFSVGRRQFSTGQRLMSGPIQHGRPGTNIPMPHPGKNRYLFTLAFTLFCMSGFTLPFLAVRSSILKR